METQIVDVELRKWPLQGILVPESEDSLFVQDIVIEKGYHNRVSIDFVFRVNLSDSFDADSIIHFLQQYGARTVTVMDNPPPAELLELLFAPPEIGAGVSEVNLFDECSYNYWSHYRDVVYSEGYENSLMASVYASLINAPLIIRGTACDSSEAKEGKNIICVGITGEECNEEFSLSELRAEYYERTQTDKIIMVNPTDLRSRRFHSFQPQKSPASYVSAYEKMSLSASYLASAKHEIIVNAMGLDFESTNDSFISKLEEFFDKEEYYLTIIGSPIDITYTAPEDFYMAKDWLYGTSNNAIIGLKNTEKMPKVGRIYGLTVSDASSYVARSVFFDEINNRIYGNRKRGIALGYSFSFFRERVEETHTKTENAGYNTPCFVDEYPTICENKKDPSQSYYQDRQFILYGGHGSPDGWENSLTTYTIREDDSFWLENPSVLTSSCLTAAFSFENPWREGPFLIAKENIGVLLLRHGAISYQGAVDPIVGLDAILTTKGIERITSNSEITLGELQNSLNKECSGIKSIYCRFKRFHVLLGDPTLKPNLAEVEW